MFVELILKYKKMKQKRKLQVPNPAEMRPLTGGGTVFKCSKTGDTILCNWMADVTACKSFEAKCPSGFSSQCSLSSSIAISCSSRITIGPK